MTIAAANWWIISILIGNPDLAIVKHHYITVFSSEGETSCCVVADWVFGVCFPTSLRAL
jgi:hypothetical protein